MARYHTVLFDADETLFDFVKAERNALCEALRAADVMPTAEMIEVYSEINLATWKRLEQGEITKEALRTERFAVFCRRFGLNVSVRCMSADYLISLATQSFLLHGTFEMCERLARHCRLYIITNGIATVQHGRFDRSPIKPFFKDIFISDELGAEKPHKAFFDEVARRVPDFDPVHTLVVGDSLTSDMAGGIGAGLDTCWFNPKGKDAPAHLNITYTVERPEDVIPLVLGI